jgi:hypothetical protein
MDGNGTCVTAVAIIDNKYKTEKAACWPLFLYHHNKYYYQPGVKPKPNKGFLTSLRLNGTAR